MNMSDDNLSIDMSDVAGVRVTESNQHFVVYNSGYEVEVTMASGLAIIRALGQDMRRQFNASPRRAWAATRGHDAV